MVVNLERWEYPDEESVGKAAHDDFLPRGNSLM